MRVRTGIVCLAIVATACTSLEPAADEPAATTDPLPAQPVSIPPERQSTFCVTMVDLTDSIRAGDVDDVDAEILATYREVAPDVPPLIADDFALVLDALERGAPPPTDPPRSTVDTAPPLTATTPPATSDSSTPADPQDADVGYAPGESPSERVNSYIAFVCRADANNPGPPATTPGAELDAEG